MSYFNQAPQQVSITIAAASTSNTATITAVGANAFIIFQGFDYDTAGSSLSTDSYTMVTLTNSTTVTASRQVGTTGQVVVRCVVIDPTVSLVTSVQQGTIAFAAATSNTATITSVNTALSAVFFLGAKSTSTSLNDALYGVTLTNATTVTATTNATSTGTVSFVVVTFAAAAINSIQKFAMTSTANSATDTQTITSVVANNTMLAWGGLNSGGINYGKVLVWGTLTNSTTITMTRGIADATTRTIYVTAIEFKSGVLNQAVQRGSITITAATSGTATITSVNTSNAFANFVGQTTGLNLNNTDDQVYHNLTLTNNTTLTATRITAGVNSSTIGYEAIEFNPSSGSGLFPFLMYDDNTSGNMQSLSGGMKG